MDQNRTEYGNVEPSSSCSYHPVSSHFILITTLTALTSLHKLRDNNNNLTVNFKLFIN
jgi:hypothetical protein